MEFSPFLFSTIQLVLFFFPSTSSLEHNNLTDLSALLAFKSQVGDPYNILSGNWTTNTPFCNWMGVSCSRRRPRVVSLHLADLPLHGTISPHIANLSFLSYLNLTNNSLAGEIPETVAHLPRLKSLTLNRNQLSGSIPPPIFNMSLLTELFLERNNLSGALPPDNGFFQMLPRIQNLSLQINELSGNIPSSLSNCSHLQRLSLSHSAFSGNIPAELGKLKKLTILDIWDNDISGGIPRTLGNLTSLTELEIGANNIDGRIPEELGDLVNLQILYLGPSDTLTGPIPVSFSNMSSLQVINLSECKLTGSLRVNFGNMPRLRKLYLGWNELSGGLNFLKSLSNCEFLEFVGLWKNHLDGPLPNSIGNLSTNLQTLAASSNHIKGKIPVGIGNLSSLTVLDFGDNKITGTIPSEITILESLQWLSLGENKLYGSVPHEIGRLRSLIKLFLGGNSLFGSIPDSLGNLSALEHLSLHTNELSSEIPRSIWNLNRLIELDLSQNFVNGSLSSAVRNMVALASLNISINQLSGNIPSVFKELQMLSILDLSNNSFDGQIPESFGDLINVAVLNLSCNNLSGVIPDSLANLRHVSSMNLSFNKLEGQVPNGGAFLNHTVTSLVGNAALCGAIKQGFPPCPKEHVSNSSLGVQLLKYLLPAIALIAILVACVCLFLKFYPKKAKNPDTGSKLSRNNYRLVPFHELVRATENFNETNLLGRGSFGSVYRGCLDDGLLVAIKVFNLEAEGALRSFDAECSALRILRHRNLVKIITVISNSDFRALVLPFMSNGSLEKWLHSSDYYLNLLQRINIAIDVASALEYLHHNSGQVVVHCDLKPSNVLLNEDMTALVSDFGIAKLLFGESWMVTSTSTPGTIGYMAPFINYIKPLN
ncbi:uncharacterized protein A4U43_C01F16340 [Asparagus officinalis]|uniref:Protein kinase domain-containing protein n=1 Tax=Asparagus officinalis TaxID=4686 RepID=A0A5P1FTI3_ASPOF|nr:putative receptor-like protein kinase At3g47110 [Asparagus officinalis]ONK80319.1 uncharacterized protein A4U43_C01F16340 [Asparagus officinalis]